MLKRGIISSRTRSLGTKHATARLRFVAKGLKKDPDDWLKSSFLGVTLPLALSATELSPNGSLTKTSGTDYTILCDFLKAENRNNLRKQRIIPALCQIIISPRASNLFNSFHERRHVRNCSKMPTFAAAAAFSFEQCPLSELEPAIIIHTAFQSGSWRNEGTEHVCC